MNTTTNTLAALSALALFAGSTQATTIYSEDFEGADFAGGTFNTSAGWASTDFTATGNINELSAPAFASHLSGLGDAFGVNFAGTTVTADTGLNFTANTQYTFSFDHFRRTDVAGDSVRAQLQTDGGVVLATEDFDAVTGNTLPTDIVNREVTYDSTGSVGVVGEGIRLVFIDFNGGTGGGSGQAGIDNIVLDAVPEPGSLALLGLGGLLIARRRRG